MPSTRALAFFVIVGVVSASSPAVDSFLAHLTGSSQRTADVERCLQTSVSPRSNALRDSRHSPLGESGVDATVVTSTLSSYPDLSGLVHCILAARAIPAPVLDVLAGPLLFSAVPLVGATHGVPGGPAALALDVLGAAPASVLLHRSPTDAGFTLLHHILTSKSVIIGQLAAYLLSLQDDRYGDRARAFAGELAEAVAGAIPVNASGAGAVAETVRAAGREMAASLGRSGVVSQAPLATLRRGMSALLLGLVAEAAARAGDSESADAQDASEVGLDGAAQPLPPQPRTGPGSGSRDPGVTALLLLAELASTPDAFGRTPLHVAGALGDAHAAAVLREWLSGASAAEGAQAGVGVKQLLALRDAAGWTPAELAAAIGAADAASALTWSGGEGDEAVLGSSGPPALPAYAAAEGEGRSDSNDADNGGWTRPPFVSEAAVRAVAAAGGDAEEAASAPCEFAVVAAAELTGDTFARAAYAPRVPVLIRGAFDLRARDAWRYDRFIAEWGHVSVSPSAVPGGAAANTAFGARPPPQVSLTSFLDALQMCDGGDPRDSPPWVDPGLCAAFAGGAGPASVWEALPRGDALAARLEAALPASVLNATISRRAAPAAGEESDAAAPVFLGSAVGGFVAAQVYVGGPGSGAPPHHHGDAWNGLAWGRKRWVVTPPEGAVFSTRTAAQSFASAAGAAGALQCTQLPGDVVYVPRGWGHAVINTRLSVGWAVERDDSLATEVVFTFGDAAWLQRLHERHGLGPVPVRARE